jgi:hypothetical protein
LLTGNPPPRRGAPGDDMAVPSGAASADPASDPEVPGVVLWLLLLSMM